MNQESLATPRERLAGECQSGGGRSVKSVRSSQEPMNQESLATPRERLAGECQIKLALLKVAIKWG